MVDSKQTKIQQSSGPPQFATAKIKMNGNARSDANGACTASATVKRREWQDSSFGLTWPLYDTGLLMGLHQW